jgi:hypothetical protein
MAHPFIARLHNMPESVPPSWQYIGGSTIHGLFDVGYAPNSDLLLTFSVDGREIFDCLSGLLLRYEEWTDAENLSFEESLSNHSHDNFADVFDDIHLEVLGIGPLEGMRIRVAGIHGGGLTKQTSDGWQLTTYSTWPEDIVVMRPRPFGSHLDLQDVWKIFDKNESVIVCGFSETGRSFIIAMPHSILMYSRIG